MIREEITSILQMSVEFVPVVVKAAMRAIKAAALQRDLTDSEADEIIDEVSSSTDRFLCSLVEVVGGNHYSCEALEELRESIHEEIMASAWAMVQEITERMDNYVNGGNCIDTKSKKNEC